MSRIITINAGSSSLKAAVYDLPDKPGEPAELDRFEVPAEESGDMAEFVESLKRAAAGHDIAAIGHRLVHGGPDYSQTVRITGSVIQNLQELAAFDPDHAPSALKLIKLCGQVFGEAAQFACFDTAFFTDMPAVAQLLPLPRRYQQEGLRRYGFHGLSYTYLQQAFLKLAGQAAADGRVIYAHLGGGASLAATLGGKPVDTTMSFTPASGLVMSSRSGDLDPGIGWYLYRRHNISPEQFNRMVNFESGLAGVSGLSADMKTLLEREAGDRQAAEAIELFCYRAAQAAGGLAASLGGLDSLIFSGGIGQQSADIRRRICGRLAFLGVELDEERNSRHLDLISAGGSRVGVHVLATDEAYVMAAEIMRQLDGREE